MSRKEFIKKLKELEKEIVLSTDPEIMTAAGVLSALRMSVHFSQSLVMLNRLRPFIKKLQDLAAKATIEQMSK